MSFFGMSDAGNTARNNLSNIAGQNAGTSSDWIKKASQYGGTGDNLSQWGQDYYNNLVANGNGTPQNIRNTGQQIMDIRPTTDTMHANNQGMWNAYNGTYGNITGNLDQQGQNIANNRTAMDSEIKNLGGQLSSQETATDKSVQGDLTNRYNNLSDLTQKAYQNFGNDFGNSYGDMRKEASGAYGDLQGQNKGMYQDLSKSAGDTFGQANQNLEQLRPGSTLQQAQVARSYAPEMAATAGAMRRSGVDPSSAQGFQMMQRARSDQSRGIDDAAAAGTNNYVTQQNNLALSQQANRQGLANTQFNNAAGLTQSGLNTDLSLGTTQAQNKQNLGIQDLNQRTNLSLDQGNQTRAQMLGSNQRQGQIATNQSQQGMDNMNNAFQQQQGLLDKRNSAASNDWQNRQGLYQNDNNQAMTDLGLSNAQYNAGQNWQTQTQDRQNQGANGMMQLGNQAYSNMFGAGSQGLGYGNSASNQYGNIYGNEAANSNWGGKLLAGMGGAVAGALTKKYL